MIRKFSASFSTPSDQVWDEARAQLNGKPKEIHEVRDAFQFLLIWQDYLRYSYGELSTILHHSNPDDPPDVVAHFENGDLSIEITDIQPPHIHQSEDLDNKVGQGRARFEVPLSNPPSSREEAINSMYLPGGGPPEEVGERNKVWFKSILERVTSKLTSPTMEEVPPGIILLTGSLYGSLGEEEAVRQAFTEVRRSVPEAANWTLATCHQWNPFEFFSALSTPEGELEIKSSSDPT